MSQQIYNATKEVRYNLQISIVFADNFILELSKEILLNVIVTIFVNKYLNNGNKKRKSH